MKPFESIIDEHGPVVLRVCRALLQPIDADEAWSETFLAAFRTYADLRNQENVRGWLVTIAHHKSVDVLRKARREPLPVENLSERSAQDWARDWNCLESAAIEVDVDALRLALASLPDKQRKAVTYRYLAELSYGEIAELLECSQAAARRSVSDGLSSLRRRATKGKPQ